MTNAIQPQNNNFNYLIEPSFANVNRLFVLSFQRIAEENNTTKDYRDFLPIIMYQMSE